MGAAAALIGIPSLALAQATTTPAKKSGRVIKRAPNRVVRLGAELAAYDNLSLQIGRLTDHSATLNLLSRPERNVVIRWRDGMGKTSRVSDTIHLPPGMPVEFAFEGLRPGTEYRYAVLERDDKGVLKELRGDCRIQTQRSAGARFSFTIQGDSHPERAQMFDAALYARTLQLIADDRADFHICMGDDFSLNPLHEITETAVRSRYELQRPFLGLVGQSSPVFLLNGNHEQASLFNYNQTGTPHNAAVWAQRARNALFPQPAPDGFFTGNNTSLDGIGPLRNYFAWTWGDALFVVLDCYWHSPACVDTQLNEEDIGGKRSGRNRDEWGITIGDEQYKWFRKTLDTSRAKFKFVFAHHVLGSGRGGIERAPFFEWGGKSNRGMSEFKEHRVHWEMPIHQLMVKAGVTIFFQGHDHLYARQELDGVIYQTAPIPADPNYAIYNDDRYLSGVKEANSGYLRISVESDNATVQYIRSYLKADETLNRKHGQVTHEYTVKARSARD